MNFQWNVQKVHDKISRILHILKANSKFLECKLPLLCKLQNNSSILVAIYCIFLQYIYGRPDVSDVAPTVAVNCDKLDLGRFYTDLPKYFLYLSEKASNDCDNFKTNPEELSTRSISWDLQSLLSVRISGLF